MRLRRWHTSAEASSEGMNLTPLIDVVFVMLIMFILIAPMLEVDRIALAEAPQKEGVEGHPAGQASAVSIRIYQNNTISINGQSIASNRLKAALKECYLRHPKQIPQLYQDQEAFFGTYQKVKNAVEEAGFETLDVILVPKAK